MSYLTKYHLMTINSNMKKILTLIAGALSVITLRAQPDVGEAAEPTENAVDNMVQGSESSGGVEVLLLIIFITIIIFIIIYMRYRSKAAKGASFGSKQVDLWTGMMIMNSAGSGKSNYEDFIKGQGLFSSDGHTKAIGGGGVAGSW